MAWLRIGAAPPPHNPRQRYIALGIGVLFAGVVFGIFKAIEAVEVPVAILSYFVYPLLTGIVGALLGLEKLGWRGIAAAPSRIRGLALTVGAHPGGIALAGVGFAVGAACCRIAVLLITRRVPARRRFEPDHLVLMLSSTAIFTAASLATWNWNGPQTMGGWVWLVVA